jgi:hypothetical protein
MYLPGISELKTALNQLLTHFPDSQPIPADFEFAKAEQKLAYVNGVIDNLVNDYDKRNIRVKQHPDIIAEVKDAVRSVLIAYYWEDLLLSDDKRPIGDYTIQQVFDQIYHRAFTECIVSKENVQTLTADQSFTKKSFENVLGKVNVPTIDSMLQYTSTISTHNFDTLFESPTPKKSDESSASLIEIVEPKKTSSDLLLNQDKTFRSDEEAIMCKITYNTEKIKFLSAQYALLELYLKFAFCEGLTDTQRIQFIQKTGYTLPKLKCNMSETPGELLKLFNKFNELLLNVEKSKEALEKNGMSI